VPAGATVVTDHDVSLANPLETPLQKLLLGTLVVNGTANSIDVQEGTLGGQGTLNKLSVRKDATIMIHIDMADLADLKAETIMTVEDLIIEGYPTVKIVVQSAGPNHTFNPLSAPITIVNSTRVRAQEEGVDFGFTTGLDRRLGCGVRFEGGDEQVSQTDQIRVVLSQAKPGDSNEDGLFNSSDLMQVFQAGQYDDGIRGNSTWLEGDWDCTGDVDSNDFITVFQDLETEYVAVAAISSTTTPLYSEVAEVDVYPADNKSRARYPESRSSQSKTISTHAIHGYVFEPSDPRIKRRLLFAIDSDAIDGVNRHSSEMCPTTLPAGMSVLTTRNPEKNIDLTHLHAKPAK
jgi:hypothetical protein